MKESMRHRVKGKNSKWVIESSSIADFGMWFAD
jgi:hypothetical protein